MESEKHAGQVKKHQLQRLKVNEQMNDDRETEDCEVGYKKPPKSRQFKKGASGNPAGRPTKLLGFGAQVMRELRSEVTITEQGKQMVITKFEVGAKQAVNKAASGNLQAIKLVTDLRQQELDRGVEQQRLANRTAEELTDEELDAIIRAETAKLIKADAGGADISPSIEFYS